MSSTAREFRHLHGAALRLLSLGTASGRRLGEIEFTAVETGQVREPATQGVEADQLGVQRTDARGQGVDLAVDLPARGLQVGLLLGHGTRIGTLLGIAAEQETPERQAGDENADDENRGQQQARPA